MLTPPPEAPTPILPMGAGGPPRRAPGRVSSASRDDALPPESSPGLAAIRLTAPPGAGGLAAVVEADPLLRLHVVAAVRQLGFEADEPEAAGRSPRAAVDAIFVGLDADEACPRCGSAGRRPAASSSLVVGYATGGRELLAAHRLHACCDLVLELRAIAGRACFAYLQAGGAVEEARLTTREADVLVLVLAGLSNAALAARLCVSPATARTHCRALLRKLGAADRRALRARLLGADPGATVADDQRAVGGSAQRSSQPAARSSPRNRP